MKTLSDAAFFRVFDALAGAGNPGLKLKSWELAGANWRRDRYSIAGADYSFVIEIFTIRHDARPRWTLLVAREHWWGESRNDALRDVRWSRPTAGRRADIVAWFRKHERAAEQGFIGDARQTAQ